MISTAVAAVAVLVSTLAFYVSGMFFGRKKWDPRGKHCLITGGSTGLGLHLSILLVKRGAHVSIVARDTERLATALAELEKARQAPTQILTAHSFAVDTHSGASAALEAVIKAYENRCPDAFFLCAGAGRPGFWVEQTEETLERQMGETYWAQAWSALVASKRMVRDGVHGKIVFVSSVLGYMSMVGWSPYSPGKFAIRGLAESLQSEFKLYDISIHCFFPGNIATPGYATENKSKPSITAKIEEADPALQPDVVAKYLLTGVENNRFHITYDFISHAFRASCRGSSPGNSDFMSQVYVVIAAIGMPLWRRDVDREVKKHAAEHQRYLVGKGLVRVGGEANGGKVSVGSSADMDK